MSDDVVGLRELVLTEDQQPSDAALEQLVEARDIDQVWEEMRSLHREIDRRWESGSVSAERALELRSRLSSFALELARLAAEREVRAYRQFLRDVSHDIRSPLHSIIFLAEALQSHRRDDRPEAEQRQLGTIYAAGTSLLNLVNDLLDYARIQQGQVEEVSEYAFTLTSVLSDVQQLLGPLVDHRGGDLRLECEDGVRFVGDPHLLNRLLTNLVSNAVEAAGEGGHVAVRLERRDGGLFGEVRDDGGDVDLEKLRALLEVSAEEAPMTRVSRELDGSVHGLGLMICGRLVRKAGGWIEVESAGPAEDEERWNDGEGTRFNFWLPFTPESGPTA